MAQIIRVMLRLRYRYFFLLLFAPLGALRAQTTLSPGDLLLVTINADGDDNFDFVPLIDLAANTVIYFADNAWDGSALKSNEGTLKYSASSSVSAGSVVSYSGSVSGDWSTEDAGFNLSGTGDNILVFQGSSSSPDFIYGVGWAKGTTWISSGSVSTNNSYIPSDISTANNTAVELSTKDNYQYNTTKGTSGTKSKLRYLLSQTDNYNGDNSTPYNALSGPFTVGQAISGNSGFRILSSPVSGQVYDDLLSPLWTQGMTGADVSSADANVWTYDASSSSWSALTNLTTASYTAGTGVIVYVFSDVDNDGDDDLPVYLNVSGTENSATVSVTTTANEWNLLGNPFESTVDADELFNDNGNFTSTVYVWDDASSAYKSWNGTAGGLTNGLIEPYQGFWIKSNTSGTSFSFEADSKTGTAGTFYKARKTDEGAITFYFESDGLKSETYVSITSSGEKGFDRQDAFQLLPLDRIRHLAAMTYIDSTAISIHNLPNRFKGTIEVPLDVILFEPEGNEFITKEATINMRWDLSGLPRGISIYLVDQMTHQSIRLNDLHDYSFNTETKGSFNMKHAGVRGYPLLEKARIKLVFASTNLGTGNQITPARIRLYPAYPNPFNASTTIKFEILNEGPVQIAVYNIRGYKVASLADEILAVGKQSVHWKPNHLSSGIYLCRLKSGPKIQTIKLLLMK